MDAPYLTSSIENLGDEISGLKAEFAMIRRDLDSLSGRISTAADDALDGISRLRTVDDRIDALLACAAEFARGRGRSGIKMSTPRTK
jgi:hypothetical protein